MNITNDSVVAIHYVLTNSEGKKLDASGTEPLVYLHGTGGLIKGLEQELDGRQAGDSFNAGFLSSLLTGGSEIDALTAGHRLAGRVLGFRGAIMPRDDT